MPTRTSPKPTQQRSAPTPASTGGPVRVTPKPSAERELPDWAKKKRGGVGGFFGRFGNDLYDAAVGTPAGLYYTGKALSEDTASQFGRLPGARGYAKKQHEKHPGFFPQSRELGEALVKQTVEDVKHPGRHPGNLFLDAVGAASLGAGTVAKAAQVSKAAKVAKTGKAKAAAKAVVERRTPGVRTFKVGDLEVQHPESRAALTRGAQRALDKGVEKAADRNPSGRAARFQARRAGKALSETQRAEEALAKAPAAALNALGKKLKPDEQYALRVVGERVPLNQRIETTKARIAISRGAERRRHAERLRLLEGARKHIADPDATPEFHPGATKLKAVYERMGGVAGGRERMGKELGLLTDESIEARKTAAARVAGEAPAGVRFRQHIKQNRNQLKADYRARFGNEIDTDKVRELFPEYAASKESRARLARETHDPASELAKELYRDALRRPKKSGEVAIFGGGTGAGKSTVSKALPEADATYDTTLSSLSSASRKIEEAKASGRNVQVHYVYRAPGDATRGMIERAAREGRTTPLEDVVRTHAESNKVIRQIAKKYENDPRVTVHVYANEPGGAREIPLSELPVLRHSEVADEVEAAYEAERAAGRIPEYAQEQARTSRGGAEPPHRRDAEPGRAGVSPGVYVPDVDQRVGRSGRIASYGAQGTAGTPRSPIRKGYTGEAKRQGREPLNTTRAVAEANLAVARYARLIGLRDKMVKAASPEPRFADDIAVRLDKLGSNKPLPKDARAFLDDPEALALLTPEEQASKFEQLRSSLIYGNDKDIANLSPEQRAEFERLHDAGLVGWVPRKLLGDLATPHAPLKASLGKVPTQAWDSVNNAQRMAVLYLKPAYAMPNVLGNAALNLVQQGFAAPKNLARASAMQWKLGPELTAQIDTMMHEGFAAALRGETGLLSSATQAAANVWGKGVDRPFRRASFLHEAARSKIKTPEQLTRLFEDPALHDTLIDITKRANREIIDYGRLSHREREIVRRVIFFYPWVKGSTMYAGQILLEHPMKAAAASELGEYGSERAREELGPAPSYLSGAFKAGGGLSNPASAAILQTPAQTGQIVASLASGRTPQVGEISELATPALQVALNLATGKNLRTGREYGRAHRGLADVGYDTLVKSTPQWRLYEGLTGRSKAKLFPSSPQAALLQFLFGGIYPRKYDPSRLRALAKREQKELAGR